MQNRYVEGVRILLFSEEERKLDSHINSVNSDTFAKLSIESALPLLRIAVAKPAAAY